MLSFFMIEFPPYTDTEKYHYYAECWLNSTGELGRQMNRSGFAGGSNS
jgi:hypothetical protein